MKETKKYVKIIFTDLRGCPGIEVPSVVYYTKLVDEFFIKHINDYIEFDDFINYIRQICASVTEFGTIYCNNFLTWCSYHVTPHMYYWPKGEVSSTVFGGYFCDVVKFGGLIKAVNNMEYDDIKTMDKSDDRMAIAMKRSIMNSTYGIPTSLVHIKDVIFNDPATIVFWSDGTKTVCTCSEQDTYDPEKGLALCVMKKVLYNNKGHIFNNAREKWLKKAKKRK